MAAAPATAAPASAITFAVVFVATVNGTDRFSQRMATTALSFVTCGNSIVISSWNVDFSGFAVTRSASCAAS